MEGDREERRMENRIFCKRSVVDGKMKWNEHHQSKGLVKLAERYCSPFYPTCNRSRRGRLFFGASLPWPMRDGEVPSGDGTKAKRPRNWGEVVPPTDRHTYPCLLYNNTIFSPSLSHNLQHRWSKYSAERLISLFDKERKKERRKG